MIQYIYININIYRYIRNVQLDLFVNMKETYCDSLRFLILKFSSDSFLPQSQICTDTLSPAFK